ncbi:MAG: hypothetical protein WC854_06575 [Bacteroidales bacterium]
MRKILRIIFLLILVISFSCEEHGLFFILCSECTAEEPLKANLEIKLSRVYNYTTTTGKIYEGNLEDSILYKTFETTGTKTSLWVSINKKYTVTARYYISENWYYVVNSVTPRVRYDKENCNDPCYFVYDRVVDLRLKYTK